MSVAHQLLTPSEYLGIERNATHRSEFFRGKLYAMTGANEPHNLIVSNLNREIGTQLKRRTCKTYARDIRVKVDATVLYT